VAPEGRPRDRAPDPVVLPAAQGAGSRRPAQRDIAGGGARAMTTTRRSLLGYPVNLVVAGRRCVVVGAGRIAARKVDGLLAAGAEVHVVASRLGDQVREWRDAGRTTAAERSCEPEDPDGAWLANAATD